MQKIIGSVYDTCIICRVQKRVVYRGSHCIIIIPLFACSSLMLILIVKQINSVCFEAKQSAFLCKLTGRLLYNNFGLSEFRTIKRFYQRFIKFFVLKKRLLTLVSGSSAFVENKIILYFSADRLVFYYPRRLGVREMIKN